MLSHEMYENVKRENTELKEHVKVLEADLEIMKYRLHVPELAENFRKEVISTVDTLKENPNRGSKYYHGARKIMYKKYRIIYKVHSDTVYIISMD